MGLFGEVDMAEIPTDPYYVAPGTYTAVVSKAVVVKPKQSDGNPAISVTFTIEDEAAGAYNGQTISTYSSFFPNATKEDFEEDQNMRKQASYLRQYLSNLGFAEDEHEQVVENLDELLGRVYVITVTESTDKNDSTIKYSNIDTRTVKPFEG